jgi:hypothetical protein
MRINVVDDSGNPLEADITVERNTTHASSLEIPSIALANPVVNVSYGSLVKSVAVDLTASSDYLVPFDVTPPKITDIRLEQKKYEDIKLYFVVTDPNQYASGPANDQVTVAYSVGGITQTTVPYMKSGIFIAEIPAPPKNSLIRFTITAYDKEGNMNNVNGEYLVSDETNTGQTGQNGTSNETQGGNETGTGGGEEAPSADYGILPFILGGIVLLVIAYAVFHYVKGVSEG